MLQSDQPIQRRPEVADILRAFNIGPRLYGQESKVVNAIKNCQTEVLGAHRYQCDQCDHEHLLYNSCGNRHCPKCQFVARARWVEARIDELLPVQYFHVVFTIPAELRLAFLQNKKLCFNLLFQSAHSTVQDVAETKLGAKVGGTSVLHTWTQKLEFHPHIHMVVPGGGLSLDGTRWIQAKQDYFLPVKALSKVFRGKMLAGLERIFEKLKFSGSLEKIKSISDFKHLLISAAENDWVVYTKSPFAGPKQVIKYLGHYTHRIAISNNRLLRIDGENVVFACKDRKGDGGTFEIELSGQEFVRRYLNHIVPARFNRIRYFGILARRSKAENLKLSRNLLKQGSHQEVDHKSWTEYFKNTVGFDPTLCRNCGKGRLHKVETIPSSLLKRRDTS